MPIEDFLPPEALGAIAEQYRDASGKAAQYYNNAKNDEDAVSGTLIPIMGDTIRGDAGEVYWHTEVKKLRGRGPGADESRFGADISVEIEIRDSEGSIHWRKMLLVQAKKREETKKGNLARNQELASQCEQMIKAGGSGLVVYYSDEGFTSVDALDYLDFYHDKSIDRSPDELGFGDALAGLFLKCKIGMEDMYYDAARQLLLTWTPLYPRIPPFLVAQKYYVNNRVRTVIRSTRDD